MLFHDQKSKYFDMKLGGGGFDCDDVIIEIYPLKFWGGFQMMTIDDERGGGG